MSISRSKKNFPSHSIHENSNATLPLYNSPVKAGPQTQYGNNRWEVYSPKLGRNVTLYSDLEYDHWVLVEVDPEVQTFCEQPLKIQIKIPIGKISTIFDMWILWNNGIEEFREVKYANDLENYTPDSRIFRQIEAQKKWCELENKNYTIITDKEIRNNQIFLANWKLILHHLGSARDINLSLLANRIELMLLEKRSSTLSEIERVFSDSDAMLIKSAVFQMVYKRKINVLLNTQPLNMKTVLEIANVEKKD